jgi:hypothetical protein
MDRARSPVHPNILAHRSLKTAFPLLYASQDLPWFRSGRVNPLLFRGVSALLYLSVISLKTSTTCVRYHREWCCTVGDILCDPLRLPVFVADSLSRLFRLLACRFLIFRCRCLYYERSPDFAQRILRFQPVSSSATDSCG